ncbi:hypothetical protein K438DRAFT_1750384 [Mycena galopus ATCC 62051]|nr:hypothetical protein K438DRAFT_1750384 [Mycena galopus ATCC 62051]
MSSTCLEKRSDEKQEVVDVSVVEVSAADVDTGAMLASGVDDLDPAEAVRIRHAACKGFAGLMVMRFILGVCEGNKPSASDIGFMNGFGIHQFPFAVLPWADTAATAQSISGFINFGILHMKPGNLASWQWLMIITGS